MNKLAIADNKMCTRWGMKVAICDDERESCAALRSLIKEHRPECEVVCFYTGRQFLETREHFDILLLDIQMEGMSGIEVAKAIRIREENTILIFVTALKDYVFEAFDVSAFHYLLKPVSEEKFIQVFGNACREAQRQEALSREQLFFQTKSRSFTVQKKEILYVESRKRKVDIHMSRECFSVYATMKHMEERLGEDFYRCHRSFLVNMAYVSEYETEAICLKNGEKVFMAREKYSEFVKAYMRFLKREGITRV